MVYISSTICDVLAQEGADIGDDGNEKKDRWGMVCIDPKVCYEPSPTFQCWGPCTMAMPLDDVHEDCHHLAPISTEVTVSGSTVTTTLSPSPGTPAMFDSYPPLGLRYVLRYLANLNCSQHVRD